MKGVNDKVTSNRLENNAILITVLAMQSVVLYADGQTDLMDVAIAAVCFWFAVTAVGNTVGDCLGKTILSLLIGGSFVYSVVAIFCLFLSSFNNASDSVIEIFIDQPLRLYWNAKLGDNFSIGDGLSLGIALVLRFFWPVTEKLASSIKKIFGSR